MKRFVTVVSLAAASVTSMASANAQESYYRASGQEYYIPSERDITDTIQQLSRQSQLRGDRLAALVQTLPPEPTTNRIFTETRYITNNSIGSSTRPAYYGAPSSLYVRPIASSAPITSGYGYRYIFGKTQMHKGVDFAAPVGTPIYATGNGVVTFAGVGTGYGRYIEIDHGNGLSTRYAHLSSIYVNVGDTVAVNQNIGTSGNSGRSTGPHLHYEVRQYGQAVNPQTYLALAPER